MLCSGSAGWEEPGVLVPGVAYAELKPPGLVGRVPEHKGSASQMSHESVSFDAFSSMGSGLHPKQVAMKLYEGIHQWEAKARVSLS